jgi:hypothetical protein
VNQKALKEKISQLESIHGAAWSLSHGHFSPRENLCITAFLVGGVVTFPFHSLSLAGISALVAVLLVLKFSKLPKSCTEALDNRLADYEPLDFLSYAELQKYTKENQLFDFYAINQWVEHETAVVRSYLPKKPTNGRGQRFINKDLTKFVDPTVVAE